MSAEVVKFIQPEKPILIRYEAACRAIAEAAAVDELRDIDDHARLLQEAARIAKNVHAEIQWSEVRLRAEIRLGELIKAQFETFGPNRGTAGLGRPGLGGRDPRPPKNNTASLKEIGISRDLSSRAQKLAALPADIREGYMANAYEVKKPGSPTGLLQEARVQSRTRRQQEERHIAASISASFEIAHCSIDDVTPTMLADDSVDAVITDPPYPLKFLPTFSSLAKLSSRVLRPGGWCVVMTGNTFLPEVMNRLCECLEYRWQYVVVTPGGPTNRNPHLGLFQAYKPILIFQKPPTSKIREWWPDIISAKAGGHDKTLHPWQQNEAVFVELVERFSLPDQLIVDPFSGSGTTGRAAVSIGRHFWGCDIDEKCATALNTKIEE